MIYSQYHIKEQQMDEYKAIDTGWFKGMLADKRLSQRKLAVLLGLDAAAVSLMLRGRRKMGVAEAAEIAKQLEVSVEQVMMRAGAGATSVSPVVSSIEPTNNSKTNVGISMPESMLELPVPMSNGTVARLLLPKQLSRADAE